MEYKDRKFKVKDSIVIVDKDKIQIKAKNIKIQPHKETVNVKVR